MKSGGDIVGFVKKRGVSVYLPDDQIKRIEGEKPEDVSLSQYVSDAIDRAGTLLPLPSAKFDEWGLISQLAKDDGDTKWVGRVRHEFFTQEIPSALVYAAETTGLRGSRLLAHVARTISANDLAQATSNDYAFAAAVDVATYAGNVLAAHASRKLIRAGTDMVNSLYQADRPEAHAQRMAEAIADITAEERGTHISDATKDVAIEVRADEEEDRQGRRITLGFDGPYNHHRREELCVPRFRGGEVCLWAARSNVGKSIAVANIAYRTARAGTPVAVFALEMRRSQMARRIASVDSGVTDDESIGGGLHNSKFVLSLQNVSKMPIHVDDRPNLSAEDIWAAVSTMLPKPRRVIVDYLGLVRHRVSDRTDIAIGDSVKALKAMGKTLGVSVDIFEQLNRAGGAREKPMLVDIQDSDKTLHHVDYVMLGRVLEERRKVAWELAKNRNYPRFGELVLVRHGDSARMEEVK